MLQAFTLVQVTGYSIPLIRIVRAWTGASPVIVRSLLLFVTVSLLVSLKAGASSLPTRVRIAARCPEMKVLASPKGDRGVTPLARNARYFSSIGGSTLIAIMGPSAHALRPR